MKKTYDETNNMISLLFIKGGIILSGCFKRIKQRMSDKKEGLLRYINKPVATEFDNLAPFDKIDNGDEYFKALDWALKDKAITNIAVSGPYGAGKSSVIETYLRKHPSIKALNISLATFKELDGAESVSGDSEEIRRKKEQKIEEGILKQLFYKVDYKKIPQSRYRKLHKVKKIVIFRKLLLLLLFCGAVANFFVHSKVDETLTYITNAGATLGIGKLLSYLVVLVMILIALFISTCLIQWFLSSWKSLEVNIVDKAIFSHKNEDEKSIFNKNLDEIVYFFETTDFDIVFIEDLDRFKRTEIFIKLRELNMILNNYEMIKRRIVFVYAIRDDMFSDKERTKFFDFIVPIIPYINSTNSNELLTQKMDELKESSEVEYHVSDRFITLVAPYISDMRVLTSICNEFVIYKKTLAVNQKLNTLDDEKMLSMMIFKNIYPKEFSALEEEEGIVKQAFEDKNEFIKRKEKLLEDELNEYETKLNNLSCEMFDNVAELKAALLFELSDRAGTVEYISVNGSAYSFDTIMNDDFDLTLLRGHRLEIHCKGVSRGNSTLRVDNIEELYIHNGLNFIERWENLFHISGEDKVEMTHKIQEIHKQIYELKALGIGKLINEYSAEKVLSEDVSKNKLLVFLLRNEFVDETYTSYINYFHPNSITADEQNFILNVRNFNGAGDFDFKIQNCKKVTERLWETEFRQEEVLNFSLLDYLIQKMKSSPECNEMIQQLSNRSDISKEFIKQYIERGNNTKQFICSIAKVNHALWEDFLDDPTLSEERKIKYLGLILEFALIDDIQAMNDINEEHNEIKKYIEDNRGILGMISNVNPQKMGSIISKLEIAFYQIETTGVASELIQRIYNGSSFVINIEMLEKYVEFESPDRMNQLSSAHFTTILEIGNQKIIDYLDDNFYTYFENVILRLPDNTKEKLETILHMFDLLEYDYESCSRLVAKEDIMVADINDILTEVQKDDNTMPDGIQEIVESIFEGNKVKICWNNIVQTVNRFGFTGKVLNYIRMHLQTLLECDDIDLVNDKLIRNVISEEWDDENYRILLRTFVIEDFTDSFSSYTEHQIKLMIESHYLSFTAERYTEMKDTYPVLATEYLIQYKDVFLEILDACNIGISVIDELIADTRMSEQEKKMIILNTDVSELDSQIAQWIRNSHEVLPKEYVQTAWNSLETNQKYELLKNHIEIFDENDLQQMFIELDTDYHALSDRSRKHKVSLYRNEVNVIIMKYLEKIGYLSSTWEEEDTSTNKVTFVTEHIPKISGNVRKI